MDLHVRLTALLCCAVGGALFAKVDGAEEAWRLGTKRIQRVLVATFFACSIGFVIRK